MAKKRAEPNPRHLETRLAPGGPRGRAGKGPLVPPIVQSATFAFDTVADMAAAATAPHTEVLYTRWGNPTNAACEAAIADLEGADRCLLFGSGMAAISTAILSACGNGDRLVATRDLYGGTSEFLARVLPRFGVRVDLVDVRDGPEGIRKACAAGAKALYTETPTNPLGGIVDLAAAAQAAKSADAIAIVDNTVATPLGQQPLALGFDLVCHSATKALAGHSDVIAGAVAGTAKAMHAVAECRKFLGGVMDPQAAFLLHRGLRTLGLRVPRAAANAQAVAEFLASHPRVRRAFYPGLPAHPGHDVARRQMRVFGSVVSFEVDGDAARAARVVDALQVFAIAPSLGGVESLATLPVAASHVGVPEAERAKMGVRAETIRLALGIEHAPDLVADLDQALRGA